VEGRGTKRQSDSFSGNKAGFVSLGRPRKNSVSPQGAKVAEVEFGRSRVALQGRSIQCFERKHNLVHAGG
jgi:hypothetical protein